MLVALRRWGLVVGMAISGGRLGTPSLLRAESPRPCQTNADCAPEGFCKKAPGDCEGTGQCDARLETGGIGLDLATVT
jgi:hypothetical protein